MYINNYKVSLLLEDTQMKRFERIIGSCYDLGEPKQRMTQAQHDIVNFLGDDDMGYHAHHWNIPDDLKRRTIPSYLIDHIDVFKHDITLIVYVPNADISDTEAKLKSDLRMKLCMKYGLRYKITKPNPEIFEDPKFAKCTALIILHSDSWTELRKNVRNELNADYKEEWKQKFDAEN